MSDTPNALAIIGVKVDANLLRTSSFKRNCDCDIDLDKQSDPCYCHNCGVVFREVIYSYIPEIVTGKNTKHCFGIYPVIFPVFTNISHAFIAMAIVADVGRFGTGNRINISSDFIEEKEKFKNTLGQILWNEKQFGLWSISRSHHMNREAYQKNGL